MVVTGGLPRALALDAADASRFAARWAFVAREIPTSKQLEELAKNVNGDPVERAVLFRRALELGGDAEAWRAFLTVSK